MNSVDVIRATARLSNYLFRNAPPLYLALYAAYKRVSERGNIALMRRLVKAGDHVADVGANVGFYAAVLAQCVGPGGRVYAFEPDETNFARLEARLRRYRQIHPVHAAVADMNGPIDLYLSPDLNVDHRTYSCGEGRKKVTANAVSLDGFFQRDETLQFIKMDIQGAEYAALRGMQALAARSPNLKILMELWPYLYERHGSGTAALLGLLESWGFEIRRVETDGGGRVGERLTASTPVPERESENVCFDVLCIRGGTLIG